MLSEIEDDVIESEPEKKVDIDALESADAGDLADQQLQLVNQQVATESAVGGVDVNEFFERYDTVTGEILASCRSDRAEVQEVIDLCRERIDDCLQNGRDPARMFVDGLVKAVEVKANVNMTAVKIMDAGARLISAGKNQINIQNNMAAPSSQDLENLLSEPMKVEDEY